MTDRAKDGPEADFDDESVGTELGHRVASGTGKLPTSPEPPPPPPPPSK